MDRVKFDYSKLKGRIVEKCGTRKAFAEMVGIAECTLVSRLKCDTYFTQAEIFKAAEILEIPMESIFEYFFTPEVHKSEQ